MLCTCLIYNPILSINSIIASGEQLDALIPVKQVIMMKLENWNINAAQVNLWLEKENRPVNPAIELSIMLGNDAEDDDERDTYWGAIRNLGKKPVSAASGSDMNSYATVGCTIR